MNLNNVNRYSCFTVCGCSAILDMTDKYKKELRRRVRTARKSTHVEELKHRIMAPTANTRHAQHLAAPQKREVSNTYLLTYLAEARGNNMEGAATGCGRNAGGAPQPSHALDGRG